jgi:hypothetical protein
MSKLTATSWLVKKALPTLLREAAAAQGLTLTQVHLPEMGGRLAYRIGDDTAAYTPGETADKLGVVWP